MLKFLRRLFLGPELESQEDVPVTISPEVEQVLTEKKSLTKKSSGQGRTNPTKNKKKLDK